MKKTTLIGFWAFLLANLFMVIWGWWAGSHGLFSSDTAGLLLAFGRLTGLLGVFCVLLEFVLIGRPVWLERFIGFDRLANWHHLNGFLALSFIFLHPILLGFSYAIDAKTSFLLQMVDFFQHFEGVNLAFISLFIFLTAVVLSVQLIKKRFKYETWHWVHLSIYLAVFLAFGHQLKNGGDLLSNKLFSLYWIILYIAVIAHFIFFRFLMPLYNFWKFDFRVDHLVQETADTWSIFITGKNLANFRVRPGQFMSFRFLDGKRWSQAHHFSISGLLENNLFRITVKKLGDFSSSVAELKKGTKVLIEGPFGVFTLLPEPKQKYLFVAGGVGITPIMSLLHQAAADNDVILLYGSKTTADIIFREELEKLSQEFPVVIHHILSNDPTYEGEKGHIDSDKLQKVVTDLRERQVYICGPRVMTDGICKFLIGYGVPSRQIHYEKFTF